jgi:hypothetical protein
LYQFFSGEEHIENNLTRSLAICLQQNPLFLHLFLERIIGASAKNIFSHLSKDPLLEIDIQKKTAAIHKNSEAIEALYGVTLTTDKIDFTNVPDIQVQAEPGNRITDISIQVKDIVIIIEAKPSNEDCTQQLLSQLGECGIEAGKINRPISLTWEDTLTLLIHAQNTYKMLGQSDVFVEDFIQLIETRYVQWLPIQPFAQLSFPKENKDSFFTPHYKRLEVIKNNLGVELIEYQGRTSIPIEVPWASEVTPYFNFMDKALNFYVWPANTKQQGWSLYYDQDQSWQSLTSIEIDGVPYELEIIPQIVFRHFNKYISEIKLPSGFSKVHTKDNHKEKSGKIDSEEWQDFATWLDGMLDIDWRGLCGWEENFLNSNRSYFTVAFGFEVIVKVPYQKLQEIDQDKDHTSLAIGFFKKVIVRLESLI